MEEIKVNHYVRTEYGEIFKLLGDQVYLDCHGEEVDFVNDITNHSPNIIDLIEVKDFIEVRIGDEVVSKFLIQDEHQLESTRIYVREGSMKILAVVTHEQFNSIKYEVII